MDTFLGPRQVQKLLLARARAPVRRDRGPVRAADGRVQVLGQRRGPLQRLHGPRSDSRDLPWSRRGGPEGPLRWQALEKGGRGHLGNLGRGFRTCIGNTLGIL